jgi:hypothetical protein
MPKETDKTPMPPKPVSKVEAYPEEWLLNEVEKKELLAQSNAAVDIFAKLYKKKSD